MECIFYIGEDYKVILKRKRDLIHGPFFSIRTVKKGQPIYLENKSVLLLMVLLNDILNS